MGLVLGSRQGDTQGVLFLEGNPLAMPPSRLKCPICKTVPLGEGELEPGLVVHPCEQCHGQWISPKDYWKWLEGHGPLTAEIAPATAPVDLPVRETETPKFCPDCGRFLRRHKVG